METITTITSSKISGIKAIPVQIEVEITSGIGIHVVGLADTTLKESLLRVCTALQSCGYNLPSKKITINIAPRDMARCSSYDLPIALGLLIATKQIPIIPNIEQYVIAGELGLNGEIRPIYGDYCIAHMAKEEGYTTCILPDNNAINCMSVKKLNIFGFSTLQEAIAILTRDQQIASETSTIDESCNQSGNKNNLSLCSIKANTRLKRAMQIAIAGGHHFLITTNNRAEKDITTYPALVKTMANLLPELSPEEKEIARKIQSVTTKDIIKQSECDKRPVKIITEPCTITSLAGTTKTPGALSHAHNGFVYLNDLNNKSINQILAHIIEDKTIKICRLQEQIVYPADFTLFAYCPKQHINKIGPLDMYFDMCLDDFDEQDDHSMTDETIKEQFAIAYKRQAERFKDESINRNGQMNWSQINRLFDVNKNIDDINEFANHLNISIRKCKHILKIARTIADLDNQDTISKIHIAEAISYIIPQH